jgi:polysaccharide export outer membrane protein
VLGPGDEVTIWALGVEEFSDKPVRIDPEGYLDLPLIGRVKAGGSTIEQLKVNLKEALKPHVLKPEVSVSVATRKSQPVSVVGAVHNPGLLQLDGGKSLVEVLSMAGGLRSDAGYAVRITRKAAYGPIPLKSATEDASKQFSVAEIRLKGLLEAHAPEENIQVQPFDVITVPTAELVYVIGEVKKSGGFTLRERENVSVLQALSLADGLGPAASPQRAKILRRPYGATERVDIPVNISKLLKGEVSDMVMQADDILFIPGSTRKKVAARAIEAGIGVGTGVIVWRR